MTVQEFIGRNPDSTLNLMTPSGYITLTPEMTKALLQGKPVLGHAGTSEARQPIPAEYLLHQELVQIHPHKTIPHYYGAITDDKVPIRELKRLETIDLSCCILRGKDFTGYHFDGANFRGTRFENVNFQDAVFLNCDLSEARFTSCQLDNAVMVNNNCYVTLFDDCSVSGMQMKGCDMEGAEARGFNMMDIQMDDMTRKLITASADIRKAIVPAIPQQCIAQADLEIMGAQHILWLHGKGGEQADFSNCRMEHLDMRHMNLSGASFDGAVLEHVDMSGASICHAVFGRTTFKDCNLSGVSAEEADFGFASFKGCDLRNSLFTHSNLRCAEVTDSNLLGMNVRNCCVENSQVQEYEGLLYEYHTAFFSESEWMQHRQNEDQIQEYGTQGMEGMV